MSNLLAAAIGSEGVRAYRMRNPELGQTMYEDSVDDELITWLGEHGMDWSGFWTNAYAEPAQAVAAVMQQHDIPVIVDVDDHFSEVPPGNQAMRAWFFQKKKLYSRMLADADRRVSSTPFLADLHDCNVAPNFVKPEEWEWEQREDDGKVTLLHAGSVNRAGDYLEKEQAFRRFLEEPNTRVLFMGWLPKWAQDYENGKVVFCRWTAYEKYSRMLRWLNPDITVSPMEHNDFNRAKSNIKWLEAGMMGAAFVGERWGEYERTVEEGVDGVLADGVEEWADVLVELARDQDLRKSVAEKGNEAVMEKWTWPAVKGQWEKAVLGVENGAGTERVSGSPEQHTAAAR